MMWGYVSADPVEEVSVLWALAFEVVAGFTGVDKDLDGLRLMSRCLIAVAVSQLPSGMGWYVLLNVGCFG